MRCSQFGCTPRRGCVCAVCVCVCVCACVCACGCAHAWLFELSSVLVWKRASRLRLACMYSHKHAQVNIEVDVSGQALASATDVRAEAATAPAALTDVRHVTIVVGLSFLSYSAHLTNTCTSFNTPASLVRRASQLLSWTWFAPRGFPVQLPFVATIAASTCLRAHSL